MNLKNSLWIGFAALVVLFALFEVRINFQFSLPGESRQLDQAQGARYATCYTDRDKAIHDIAFSTIDNPDVQKLYISNNRDKATAECRQLFPEQWTTVDEPLRFNVIDLRFRY